MKSLRYKKKYNYDYRFLLPKLTSTEIWPIRNFLPDHHHVVFDVGANHGVWAKAWLDSYGNSLSSMHLFEPLPGNLEKISDRLRDGYFSENLPGVEKKISVNKFALGERPGVAVMHHDVSASGFASIAQDKCVLPGKLVDLGIETTVNLQTLESYCIDFDIGYIDVMKIDVEGFELNVLKGGQSLLESQKIGFICFEFGSHQLAQNHHFKMFWELFNDNGYKLLQFGLGRQGWDIKKITQYVGKYENYSSTWMFGAYLPKFEV